MTEFQPTKTNGQTPDELAVEAAVLHHVSSYKQVCAERDELQRKVNKQEQMLTVAKIEVEGLRADAAVFASRMEGYQLERDDAIADLAIYQTLFTTVQALLRTFGIEHAPLVKKLPYEPSA